APIYHLLSFFFQAEDGIRDDLVTGVQTCALPISEWPATAILVGSTLPVAMRREMTKAMSAGSLSRSLWSGPPGALGLSTGNAGEIGRASCRERGERGGGGWVQQQRAQEEASETGE